MVSDGTGCHGMGGVSSAFGFTLNMVHLSPCIRRRLWFLPFPFAFHKKFANSQLIFKSFNIFWAKLFFLFHFPAELSVAALDE